MRRTPSLLFWILLGLAIVAAPIACSSSSTNNNVDAHADGLTPA